MRGIKSAKSLLWERWGLMFWHDWTVRCSGESAAAAKPWVLRDGNHWLQLWLSKQLFCPPAAVEFLFLPFSGWLLMEHDSLSWVISITSACENGAPLPLHTGAVGTCSHLLLLTPEHWFCSSKNQLTGHWPKGGTVCSSVGFIFQRYYSGRDLGR